mmetsp:Transcript_116459/g.340712  ORF Transcript_116459/g.340712 Transcript_116459/m.340712 type:complete len:342 (+) Transcript_116459:2-1027(+)
MAGMQPATARELLRLLPEDARAVLDVFCGSGTVLIEALAAGRRAVGNDASPMAVFVASHHCDINRVDLEELLQLAEKAAAPLRGARDDWQELRNRIGELATTAPLREALWFVFVVALRVAASTPSRPAPRRTADPEGGLARPYFLSNAYRYVAQVRALRRACPTTPRVSLHRGDVRQLRLAEPVDAIITSPPYPGVYNYIAAATEDRRMLGSVAGVGSGAPDFLREAAAGAFDTRQEVGAQELRTQQSLEDFLASWQKQQEEWLRTAYANLRPGGTATIMIGDGDTEYEEGGVDCLASTIAAAEAAGFAFRASASVESCADAAHRTKGMVRTEHMVHLHRP